MQRIPLSRKLFLWLSATVSALLLVSGTGASAQEKLPPAKTRLSLSELINLGLTQQPSLAAARASLAAAQSGQAGLNSLPACAALIAKDLPIRKQQSCWGVTIAAAALQQAEWETRYAVVRNYYSIVYARKQLALVQSVRQTLEEAVVTAEKLLKAGNPDIKITTIDRDSLKLSVELVKSREAEASVGIQKAFAALREALGVGLDYNFDIEGDQFPPLVASLNKEELVAQALANRGEMTQAAAAYQVTAYEVQAQSRILCHATAKTFAISADIHVQPIPQGVANGEYRPGAIGIEMPPMLVGKRPYRVQRAQDLNDRAAAVVEKTTNLITLEVEATYLKWVEAATKARNLEHTPKMAKGIYDLVKKNFDEGRATGEELLRARGTQTQVQADLNEALYLHALALAALERVTAGGYRLTAKLP